MVLPQPGPIQGVFSGSVAQRQPLPEHMTASVCVCVCVGFGVCVWGGFGVWVGGVGVLFLSVPLLSVQLSHDDFVLSAATPGKEAAGLSYNVLEATWLFEWDAPCKPSWSRRPM